MTTPYAMDKPVHTLTDAQIADLQNRMAHPKWSAMCAAWATMKRNFTDATVAAFDELFVQVFPEHAS